jgi:hypothetical protein
MVRIMFDSDNPGLLAGLFHAGEAGLIATYADLVTPALADRAGGDLLVIDRGHGDPHHLATCGDFERGALKPADAPDWWDAHHGRGELTVYADRSTMPSLIHALGPHRPAWRWWATLDGTMRIPANPTAMVQFAGEKMTGFHADATIIYNPHWRP